MTNTSNTSALRDEAAIAASRLRRAEAIRDAWSVSLMLAVAETFASWATAVEAEAAGTADADDLLAAAVDAATRVATVTVAAARAAAEVAAARAAVEAEGES